MQTFAQKQNQSQKPVASSLARPKMATPGPDHREHPMLHLQRTIGNQAVLRMLQTHSEKPDAGLTDPPAAGVIQTKLAINKPGDEYEQEADRASEQVMRMPEPQSQRACACGGSCADCQKEQPGQEHERLQMKRVQASDLGQTAAPPVVHEVLRSHGQPLDAATRAFMEPHFGYDLSRVCVHADARAAASARALGAFAYTVGSHIVFGEGQYQPRSSVGGALLAHELAHVLQQSGSGESTESSAAGHIAVVQRTRAPMLQRFWITTEAAGGCGVCYKEVNSEKPYAAAGTAAHGVIQKEFVKKHGRMAEFKFKSPTDENGKLDLAVRTPTGFKIGEIKPGNKKGYEDGIKDLYWYKDQLQFTFPQLTIEMLDERLPSGLRMPDPFARAARCWPQILTVTPMSPGMYGYWCMPPFSVIRPRCSCRPPAPEDTTEFELAQATADIVVDIGWLIQANQFATDLEPIIDVEAVIAGIAAATNAAIEGVEEVGIVARGLTSLWRFFEAVE